MNSSSTLRHAPRSLRRARGMTTIGMLILLAFLGLFAFAGIRLLPVYLNYMKVASAVENVKEEFDGQGPTVGAIRKSLQRRFSLEDVVIIEARDVEVRLESGGFLVDASYQHTVPYIANVSFTVDFDITAVVRR